MAKRKASIILCYRNKREVVLRRRKGGACPILDLEKEHRKGLFSLIVQADDGETQLIALNWTNDPKGRKDND